MYYKENLIMNNQTIDKPPKLFIDSIVNKINIIHVFE
jgi:hypothetical protein